MSENRDFIYTIPQTVLEDCSLNGTDLRVYMYVRSFMDTTKDAYFSNEWAAKRLNIDPLTVSRSISKLVKKQYLTRLPYKGQRHLVAGRPIKESVVNTVGIDEGLTKTSRGVDENVKAGVDENVNQLDQRSITSKKINNIVHFDFSDDEITTREVKEAFERLWDYYPIKKGKKKAQHKFFRMMTGKTKPQIENLTKTIWDGIVAMLQEHRWLREINEREGFKEFIAEYPHGATWFEQERWSDERETDPVKFLEKIKFKNRGMKK